MLFVYLTIFRGDLKPNLIIKLGEICEKNKPKTKRPVFEFFSANLKV